MAKVPSGCGQREDAHHHEGNAKRIVGAKAGGSGAVKEPRFQKQIKFGEHEAERHERDRRAQPGQERALIGEQVPRLGVGAPVRLVNLARSIAPPASMPLPGSGLVGRDYLVVGDGLAAMAVVPDQALDAVYLDPPFFTRADQVGDRGRFDDRWASLEDYLAWLTPWVQESHRILKPSGWLWLHLDWHAVHYAKVMADGIFGRSNFRNEIVWAYGGRRMPGTLRFNQKHDILLLYARSAGARLVPLFLPWTREEYLQLKRQHLHRDADGREWIWGHAGRGHPKAYRIDVSEAVSRGRAVTSVWDIPILNTSDRERVGYPTQKPLELLRRVVAATVPPDGMIGDFMLGSGTTAVAARKLSRKFVGADVSTDAIKVAVERLTALGAAVAEGSWAD